MQSKMLESPISATPAAAAVLAATLVDPTTTQHQQMARKIENGDFAEDYFASLTGPAKRLIEVRNNLILLKYPFRLLPMPILL